MKFEELWDKFEQSGNIQDYLNIVLGMVQWI